MRVPDEIFVLVARAATETDALDTAIGCTNPSMRASVLLQLLDVNEAKRALCLVSRAARTLCTPFMYEVVSIYDPRRIGQTLDSLRQHGRWCRRLDVDIVCNSSTWPHGAASLWGLIHACPRLEILNISLIRFSGLLPPPLGSRFCCPLSLLIQIADLYGGKLRRLELGGDIAVHSRGLDQILACCPALEVLAIPGLFASPADLLDITHDDSDLLADIAALAVEHIDAAGPHMTAEERTIVLSAQRKAVGLQRAPLPPVSLLALHTLELGQYVRLIAKWCMPALRALHTSHRPFWVDLHVNEVDDQPNILILRGQELRAWTYHGYDLQVLAQLDSLPCLEYLAFNPADTEIPTAEVHHATLREIDLCPRLTESVWPWVTFILEAVRNGRLPSLRACRVLHWREDPSATAEFLTFCTAFKALGVHFEGKEGGLAVRAIE